MSKERLWLIIRVAPTEFVGFPIFSFGHRRFHSKGSKERWRGKTRVIPYLCKGELGAENSCWPSLRVSRSNMFAQRRGHYCLYPSALSPKNPCCAIVFVREREKMSKREKREIQKNPSSHDSVTKWGPGPPFDKRNALEAWVLVFFHCWFNTSSFDGNTFKVFWRKFQDGSIRAQYEHKIFELIELPAKLIDYFLHSNKSNINQWRGFVSDVPSMTLRSI